MVKCNFKITYLDTGRKIFCILKIMTEQHYHEECDGKDCIFQKLLSKEVDKHRKK